MQPPPNLVALARAAAARHKLDPALVCALIEQESAWNPYAIRYEPAFRERYVVPLALAPTEEIARATSWGLMQVMGQVARENGFRDASLAELCSPTEGLDVGCAVLAAKLSAANGNVSKGLALWNGGAQPAYSSEVLARCQKYDTSVFNQSCAESAGSALGTAEKNYSN